MDQQIDNQKFKQIKAGPYNKFVAAKRFKKFENAKVVVDKSKNKTIVTTFHTEKEDVREKGKTCGFEFERNFGVAGLYQESKFV